MHNTVYLYDADHERRGPDGQTLPLWATWLGQPRPGGGDIDMWAVNDPEWGILSTPVIDPAKSIAYVVVEAPGLNPRSQKQRTGLLLTGGVLYVAFGGDGSRGLVAAYDAATLSRRAGSGHTSPGFSSRPWPTRTMTRPNSPCFESRTT